MIVAFTLVDIGLLLAVGALWAWRGPRDRVFFCFQTWFTLPLFFIVVVGVGVVVAFTGVMLTVNSGE